MMMPRKTRPTFFNLAQIELPVGALTSIAHRISGLLLAVGTPAAIYLLDLSVRDAAGYARVAALFGEPLFRAASLLFIWALAHHLFAGVRHLLTDIDLGSQLQTARRSAWLANLGGLTVMVLALGAML